MGFRFRSAKFWCVVRIVMVMLWLTVLSGTNALFSGYVVCEAAAVLSAVFNERHGFALRGLKGFLRIVFSGLFTFCTVLSNHNLFTVIQDPALASYSTSILENLINVSICVVSSYFVGDSVISCALRLFPMKEDVTPGWLKSKDGPFMIRLREKPVLFWLLCFLMCSHNFKCFFDF